jgi:hypothetical protein
MDMNGGIADLDIVIMADLHRRRKWIRRGRSDHMTNALVEFLLAGHTTSSGGNLERIPADIMVCTQESYQEPQGVTGGLSRLSAGFVRWTPAVKSVQHAQIPGHGGLTRPDASSA